VAFSMLPFTMCSTTLFFINPHLWCVTQFTMQGIICWNICKCLFYLSFTPSIEACLLYSCHNFLNLLTIFCQPPIPSICFLYDLSPISVPKAQFICCHSKFFLQAFNPSSLSIRIPCLLNQ